MIIVYYRDSEGKIVRHHTAPDDWTLELAQERIDQFNSEQSNKATAYALQAEDGSIEAYLYQKAQERAKWNKDALRNAISAIEDALDEVRGLEG